MVGALGSGVGSPGFSPGCGHCVVFLGKTLLLQCLSPPRCINGYQQTCCWIGVEILLVTSCYRNGDMLQPDGSQLARMQTLPLP